MGDFRYRRDYGNNLHHANWAWAFAIVGGAFAQRKVGLSWGSVGTRVLFLWSLGFTLSVTAQLGKERATLYEDTFKERVSENQQVHSLLQIVDRDLKGRFLPITETAIN